MLPLPLVVVTNIDTNIVTNIVVSAVLKPDGLLRTVVLLAITKPARLHFSTAVLSEYRDVLSRPELSIRKGPRSQLLQLIRSRGHLVSPSKRLQIASDPDDNIFIEWCRCRWRRLPGDRQRSAFSGLLEKNQDRYFPRVYGPCRAASRPMTVSRRCLEPRSSQAPDSIHRVPRCRFSHAKKERETVARKLKNTRETNPKSA